MSRLCLKIRAKKFYLFWIVVSFCTIVPANENSSDADFYEYCKTSDAYLLYSYIDVVYAKVLGTYTRNVIIQKKLVVNNRFGVEKYAFLVLSKFSDHSSKKIRIKTHKANGSTVELDSELVLDYMSDNEETDYISYPIPGVEPGDTIETYYEYKEYLKSYELSDFVSLYEQVPSLNS